MPDSRTSQELLREKLSETKSLGLSPDGVATIGDDPAKIMLLVLGAMGELKDGQHITQSILAAQNGVLSEHKSMLTTGATTMANINETTMATNGRVNTLRIDVDALMTKDGQRTAQALTEAIAQNAVKSATEGVWMIPRPNWKTITLVVSIVAFFGYDRIAEVLSWVGEMLQHVAAK